MKECRHFQEDDKRSLSSEKSEAYSYKHVYHIPTVKVNDKTLSDYLNNYSVQKQPSVTQIEEESKSIIVQQKQPTLRLRVHLHNQASIRAMYPREPEPYNWALERKKARSRVVHLKTKSMTERTAITRTRDHHLSKSSVDLLRRHVNLSGRYDFELMSRCSKIPITEYLHATLRRSLSPPRSGTRNQGKKMPMLRGNKALNVAMEEDKLLSVTDRMPYIKI